jgi:sugar phosphate isomerase/epimerase
MVTGQDPVEGVNILRDYIVHTHAKDGRMHKKTDPKRIYDVFAGSVEEGLHLSEFFTETPLGEGSVDFPQYLSALRDIGYSGYLTVEREVGQNPAGDIQKAFDALRGWING